MTGFLERLTLRGTGRAPQPGLVTLKPRQRSRFEPSSSFSDLAAESTHIEERADVQTRSREFTPASQKYSPSLAEPSASDKAPSESARDTRRDSSTPPRNPATSKQPRNKNAITNRSADSAVPVPSIKPIHSDEVASAREKITEPVSPIKKNSVLSESETTKTTQPAGRASSESIADDSKTRTSGVMGDTKNVSHPSESEIKSMREEPVETRNTELLEEKTASRPVAVDETAIQELQDKLESPVEALPVWEREENRQESLNISIGQIKIEFVQPQPQPAPAPPAPTKRTRGFDAYTRARRGIPR